MSPTQSHYSLGIIGYPLDHSLSPRLHTAALRDCGLPGEYRSYLVPPFPAGQAILEALLASLRDGLLNGLNVTIPHKQTVIPYLDDLTPLARHVGAVNTIFRLGDRLIGDNTDAPGFLADLNRVARSVFHQSDTSCNAQHALVLGAGGSARAVIYALLNTGWRVTIAARRLEQARAISDQCSVVSLQSLTAHLQPSTVNFQFSTINLIVNTTPVGMAPNITDSPWPAGLLIPPGAFVYDLVYNPPETTLTRQAHAQGLPAATGLGMLIEQAALAFERWTGLRPDTEVMRRAVANL
jgi:shikimate dehydrogenase